VVGWWRSGGGGAAVLSNARGRAGGLDPKTRNRAGVPYETAVRSGAEWWGGGGGAAVVVVRPSR
jgi:hypothetical protein